MKVKYAVYTAISNNLGDNVQAYAIYQLFKYMDIPDTDIVVFNRYNILEKIEAETFYILPCSMAAVNYYDIIEYLTAADKRDQFVFIPLSVGLIRNSYGDEYHFKKVNYLSDQFIQPIGCRDYDSQLMYEKQGYPAYVYGCITSTLPRRNTQINYDKIYLYDVPKSLRQYLPQDIKNKAVTLSKTVDVTLEPEKLWELCIERYELLRDTAKLVITVNYHVATPCVAMGIPVIMVDNCHKDGFKWSNDTRLPALNPTIPYYTKEQWGQIDWTPRPAEFEEIKDAMIDLAVARIKDAVTVLKVSGKLSDFMEPSRRRFLDICNQNIDKVDVMGLDEFLGGSFLSRIESSFKFYLYGLSDRYIQQEECILLSYIKRRCPEAEFLGFVDGRKTGVYFGKEVLSPDKIEMDDNTYCFVSAYTANDYVAQFFMEHGFDNKHLWLMPQEILFYVYHL